MIGTPRCTRQARRGCETSEAQATVSVVPESSTERAHLFSLSSNDAPRTFLHFAPEITNLPTRSDPKGCRQEYCSVSQRDFQKNIGVILAGRRARWTRGLRTGQAPVPCAAPPSAHCSPGIASEDGKGIKNPWWEEFKKIGKHSRRAMSEFRAEAGPIFKSFQGGRGCTSPIIHCHVLYLCA